MTENGKDGYIGTSPSQSPLIRQNIKGKLRDQFAHAYRPKRSMRAKLCSALSKLSCKSSRSSHRPQTRPPKQRALPLSTHHLRHIYIYHALWRCSQHHHGRNVQMKAHHHTRGDLMRWPDPARLEVMRWQEAGTHLHTCTCTPDAPMPHPTTRRFHYIIIQLLSALCCITIVFDGRSANALTPVELDPATLPLSYALCDWVRLSSHHPIAFPPRAPPVYLL